MSRERLIVPARPHSDLISDYEDLLCEGCWPNRALGNHDWKRITSRVCADQSTGRDAAKVNVDDQNVIGANTVITSPCRKTALTLSQFPLSQFLHPT